MNNRQQKRLAILCKNIYLLLNILNDQAFFQPNFNWHQFLSIIAKACYSHQNSHMTRLYKRDRMSLSGCKFPSSKKLHSYSFAYVMLSPYVEMYVPRIPKFLSQCAIKRPKNGFGLGRWVYLSPVRLKPRRQISILQNDISVL